MHPVCLRSSGEEAFLHLPGVMALQAVRGEHLALWPHSLQVSVQNAEAQRPYVSATEAVTEDALFQHCAVSSPVLFHLVLSTVCQEDSISVLIFLPKTNKQTKPEAKKYNEICLQIPKASDSLMTVAIAL